MKKARRIFPEVQSKYNTTNQYTQFYQESIYYFLEKRTIKETHSTTNDQNQQWKKTQSQGIN